jgi:integral membrane sensor domain MASE1
MNKYHHHVSGIFQRHADALMALAQLKKQGLPAKRMQIFESDLSVPKASKQGRSNEVLKNLLVQAVLGGGIGAALGGLAQVAIVLAGDNLFAASPWLAPLAMLGWGATVGATLGAAIGVIKRDKTGSKQKQSWLSDAVRQAITSGQAVLVVETFSKEETELAGEVMKLTVNNFQDVSMA